MTTPRWLTPLLCTLPALRPARALLTPTWLVALALLGLNDHLLKGAGVLPGAVTGKLSDLAGMLVAPALLAALLGLRSRRGVLLAHLAVAAVFAAIKLSPAAADAWSWTMGLVGFPWRIVVDPTDLLALPALALGWRALVPAMARPAPAVPARLPRLAHASAAVVGTALCVATSPPPRQDDGGEWEGGEGTTDDVDYVDISADVYLHNAADRDIVVRTRELRASVELDCATVAEDPGLLLSESLFGEGRTWTLPPTTNAPARDVQAGTRACYAVRVEGDALVDPFVLFWAADDPTVQVIDGDIDDPALHSDGAVLLGADADGRVSVTEARSDVVFPIDLTPPVDAFRPGPDAGRLAWSDPPEGAHRISGLAVGPDGCAAIDLDDGLTARWYLCVPEGALPFAVGERVEFTATEDAVILARIPDPEDPTPVPELTLHVSRGERPLGPLDAELAHRVDYAAEIAPDPVCGTVSRPGEISARFLDGDVVTARPGESRTLASGDDSLTLWVAHAEQREVLDPECAEGPDRLGADVEVVAVVVRAPLAP
jgi:hypothetical protein